MKAIFGILVFFIFLSGCDKKQPEWKSVFDALNVHQKEVLEVFFRFLVEDTVSGYTLFGEKPLSIETIASSQSLSHACLEFYDKHHKSEHIIKLGFEIFDSLPIKSSNYFFVVSGDVYCGSKELSIGNRKKLKSIVEKNLCLFQYVLGPKFSEKDILQEIECKRRSIYSIFHTNRVLVGIVLGFGIQNALKGSRSEYIDDQFYSCESFLPFKSSEIKKIIPSSFSNAEWDASELFHHKIHRPSFSFSTLDEEKRWLEAGQKLSLKHSINGSKASFPWYGYWNSGESQELIESYQKTQKYLNEILKSDRFLEIVFERIFGEK